jgi:hypothetical protein
MAGKNVEAAAPIGAPSLQSRELIFATFAGICGLSLKQGVKSSLSGDLNSQLWLEWGVPGLQKIQSSRKSAASSLSTNQQLVAPPWKSLAGDRQAALRNQGGSMQMGCECFN